LCDTASFKNVKEAANTRNGSNTLIYNTNVGCYAESKNIVCWVYKLTMR